MGKEKSCCLSHFMCGVECTVEPLYKGRHWDPADCPVYRGVPNSEVDLYTSLHTYVVGNADSVLIREVAFIQSVLYREVPLHSLTGSGYSDGVYRCAQLQ